MSKDESGFIVNAWRQIFESLSSKSVFTIVKRFVRGGKGSACFSEMWTLGNFFFSIAYLLLFSHPSTQRCVVTILLCIYPILRISEIVVYHINIFLSLGELQGFRRSLVLLFHNYIEVLFWFACFYRLLPKYFEYSSALPTESASSALATESVGGSLYFSLVTMSTLGYGDIKPVEIGRVIVSIQTLIGLFMGICLLARFISMLPQIRTKDPEEQEVFMQNQKDYARLVAEEVEKIEKHKQG